MRWGMVIDLTRCARCFSCVAACRLEHFLPPDMSWPRLMAFEQGEYPDMVVSTYPVRCNECADPSCIDVCPTGANQQREDGIVWIDQNKCVGCRYCIIACPYQSRTFLPRIGEGRADRRHRVARVPHLHERRPAGCAGTSPPLACLCVCEVYSIRSASGERRPQAVCSSIAARNLACCGQIRSLGCALFVRCRFAAA